MVRFDDRDGDIGLGREDVIGPFSFSPADHLAAHDDPSLGEADLFADLAGDVPSGGHKANLQSARIDRPAHEHFGRIIVSPDFLRQTFGALVHQ